MAILESEQRVHSQQREKYIDFWRIGKDNSLVLHESHPIEFADRILSERSEDAQKNLRESKINLGLNTATIAILFAQVIRERSKKLAAISIIPAVGIIFSARNLQRQKNEIDWLEKESRSLGEYLDRVISAPQE